MGCTAGTHDSPPSFFGVEMRAIPVIVSEDYYDLFIILEEENIRRMKTYDPAELLTTNLPVEFITRKVNNIVLMYATADDLKRVTAACAMNDVSGALRILSRGFQWRPDRGDKNESSGYEPDLGD
jgi:hypothetical protein